MTAAQIMQLPTTKGNLAVARGTLNDLMANPSLSPSPSHLDVSCLLQDLHIPRVHTQVRVIAIEREAFPVYKG